MTSVEILITFNLCLLTLLENIMTLDQELLIYLTSLAPEGKVHPLL